MGKWTKAVALVVGVAALATCHQSIFTAPPDSTITVLANPESIPANGGVSVITAVVYDATGQPVPDGTVVQFFTNLGRIPEQGKTNDGVARVNLVADGRSGDARVIGLIGGGSVPAPSTSPTPRPSGSPTSSSPALGAPTASGPSALARTSAVGAVASASDDVTVSIGTQLPTRIFLAADPRNIPSDGPRFSTLTATVFDKVGNPIANIPVVFRITKDDDFTESLDSRGLPVYTDNNGQAKDRLWTSVPRARVRQQVGVSAVTAGASGEIESDVLTVGINF